MPERSAMTSMRRYYFHLYQGEHALLDHTGLLLPDLASAMREAREAAHIGIDLAACDQSGWRIEVADERGTRLITYHFPNQQPKIGPAPKARSAMRSRADWGKLWRTLCILGLFLLGRGWRRRGARPVPEEHPPAQDPSARRPEARRQG